jgi:hypothetical protein
MKAALQARGGAQEEAAYRALLIAAIEQVRARVGQAADGGLPAWLSARCGVDTTRLKEVFSADAPLESDGGLLNGKEWYRVLNAADVGLAEWIGAAKCKCSEVEAVGMDPALLASSNGIGPPPELDQAIKGFLRASSFFFIEASNRWLATHRSYVQSEPNSGYCAQGGASV